MRKLRSILERVGITFTKAVTYKGNTMSQVKPYTAMFEAHVRIIFVNGQKYPVIEASATRFGANQQLSIADIVNAASKLKSELRHYESYTSNVKHKL